MALQNNLFPLSHIDNVTVTIPRVQTKKKVGGQRFPLYIDWDRCRPYFKAKHYTLNGYPILHWYDIKKRTSYTLAANHISMSFAKAVFNDKFDYYRQSIRALTKLFSMGIIKSNRDPKYYNDQARLILAERAKVKIEHAIDYNESPLPDKHYQHTSTGKRYTRQGIDRHEISFRIPFQEVRPNKRLLRRPKSSYTKKIESNRVDNDELIRRNIKTIIRRHKKNFKGTTTELERYRLLGSKSEGGLQHAITNAIINNNLTNKTTPHQRKMLQKATYHNKV